MPLDLALLGHAEQQAVEAGDLEVAGVFEVIGFQLVGEQVAGGDAPDLGRLGVVDARDGRGAGDDLLDLEAVGDVQDGVGQLVALGRGLVIADEEDEVVLLRRVFVVEELALGEAGLFDDVFADGDADGVEEVRGVQAAEFLEGELGLEVVGDNHGDVADAGPGRHQVGGVELGPRRDPDNAVHILILPHVFCHCEESRR